MWMKGKSAKRKHPFLCEIAPRESVLISRGLRISAKADLRANLEVILPMREVEVPRVGEAAACCDRLGEAGGPL